MIRTVIAICAGGLFLSLVCMDEPDKRVITKNQQQTEDVRVRGFREGFFKTKPDIFNSLYMNNPMYVDEAPRLFYNAIKFENDQVVMDFTPLEEAIIKAQGRNDRIETTKFKLKTFLIVGLLSGCSFTLGVKFATILMKNSQNS